MRVPQLIGQKGSLKWIQRMLTQSPSPLDAAIRSELGLPADVVIDWRSPRAEDDHAEYRDEAFLEVIGLSRLRDDLKAFWPSKGPQWDALGVTSDQKVILIEAKAHASEMASTCDAGPKSRGVIVRALDATKGNYGAHSEADWTVGYYQYANRLAHLNFLRERGVDAHLVFVYFLNDRDVRGPASAIGWADALDECYSALGLSDRQPIKGLHSLFIDVA